MNDQILLVKVKILVLLERNEYEKRRKLKVE